MDNETRHTSNLKSKSINFIKNGFLVNEAPGQKAHYRSRSNHFSSTKRESTSHLKERKSKRERINTETNFKNAKDE